MNKTLNVLGSYVEEAKKGIRTIENNDAGELFGPLYLRNSQ